ncbi:MAG TPA: UvrD-helicase domain-containing protein, partial [Ktedonobacterales bacterium]|nr:UvrD-helicase domain-containing protein [Ktedonobacterales bacterium]
MDDLARPRLAAERALRWWAGQRAAPAEQPSAIAMDIDALLAQLGLEVAPFHHDSRARGALGWLEPGEDLIFIRDDLPEPVRRFTLAHELGHALLHRADGPQRLPDDAAAPWRAAPLDEPADDAAAADLCDDSDLDLTAEAAVLGEETLGAGQAYSARAHREHEANAFAAALLLPPELLRARYLGADGAPGLAPRALAQAFAVSEEAVHQGLAALLGEPAPASDGPSPPRAEAPPAPALDRWQRAATAAKTPALVVAGPGTGKTSTLVGRVAYLTFERGVAPDAILALTFSNKAAREMRERLAALLAGRAAGDAPAVGTIHAFCGDLLRRYGPLVGLRPDYRLITEAEGYLLLRAVTADLALGHYQPLAAPAMHFPALLGAISRAKDELTDPDRYAALADDMRAAATTDAARRGAQRAAEVARVYAAYQRALEEGGNADFGDLIRLAVRLLREQPSVVRDLRARYAHVLVDEFQD